MSNYLPTNPYKGVRDFYPDDMAIQRYMFDVWSQTAESFGYERYDASVLEPADLYKACLLYTSPSPRDGATSRMPSSA